MASSGYDPNLDKKLSEEKICDGGNGTMIWGSVCQYNGGERKYDISRWLGNDPATCKFVKLGRLNAQEAEACAKWLIAITGTGT